MALVKKVCLGLMLLFWLGFGIVCIFLVFRFCQGPEPSFDLGHGYWVLNWPGTLIHWQSREDHDYEQPFLGKVVAFEVRDPWLIGRTEVAWFAINTVENSTHHPLESEASVEAITGLTVTASDLVTNPWNPWFPSRYEWISPGTKAYVTLAAILYFGFPFFVWFVIHLKRGDTKRSTGASEPEDTRGPLLIEDQVNRDRETPTEPRDIRLLKEMQGAIIAFQSKGRGIADLADHLLTLRDQLQFKDDVWFHELTQHIATLDSGPTYVPTNDEQAKQSDAATATAINGIQRLIKDKLA